MFVNSIEVDGKKSCMQKAIQITEIVQTSIKEFFPFLSFAFFWLFLIITPILIGQLLLLSNSLFFLGFIYVVLGWLFVWFIAPLYLLDCFYKKQSPSFIQLCQCLKTCFFPMSIEILRVIICMLPILFVVFSLYYLLYYIFEGHTILTFFLFILLFLLFVWLASLAIRFLFIPAITLFNSSYQKKQIDALEYSKVLTKGYRLSIFGCFLTFNMLVLFVTVLSSYVTYFILSLFFNEVLPVFQEYSLALFDWFTILFSYFSVPFSSILYYKFYMSLEDRLQNLETEEFSSKRGINNLFNNFCRVLF